MTLLELAMASGVLALFLGMVAHAVVLAYRSQAESSRESAEYRRAVNSMEWIGRELRMCEYLYSPVPASFMTGTVYRPEVGVAAPFIFRRYNAATDKLVVVGYTYDPAQETVIRAVYDPGYDPANAGTQTVLASRVLTENAKQLEFTWIDPTTTYGSQLVRARLEMNDVQPAPEMEVKVKKL